MGWSRIFRRAQWDRERAREIDEYLEIETASNLERGMTAAEARLAARRKLGNTTIIREEIYRMNSIGSLETLWQDVQYAVRVLRKSPAFALVTILSLALGIGANTAVFSVVNAVLLRPLPYSEPGRLVRLWRSDTRGATNLVEYNFWKQHCDACSSVANYREPGDYFFRYGDTREWIRALDASQDFFATLGVKLATGREFNADETRPGGPGAAVITHDLAERMFGSDRGAVGQVFTLGGGARTVVGVLPANFWLPQATDMFIPLRPSNTVGDEGFNDYMIARLKPGIGIGQAEAEMPAITAAFLNDRPPTKNSSDFRLAPVPFRTWVAGDVRLKLLLLMGATALLLLIACTNLAGLLLARLEQRQREVAVRLALGSSTGRLMRQFAIENVLLCAAGGLAGIVGAAWVLNGLVALIPFQLPASAPIRLDAPVLLFSMAVVFVTALAFSLTPFVNSTRVDLHEALNTGGRGAGSGSLRQRARSILVVSEVALSVTLLVSAALLIQSLYRLHQERLGFAPRGLLTFFAPPSGHSHSAAELWAYHAALSERLKGLPGVHSVAGVNRLPLTSQNNYPTQAMGRPDLSIGGMEIRVVTPGYFDVMGIRILRGRALDLSDGPQSQPVVLVSETVARRWWPDGNVLGQFVLIGHFEGKDYTAGVETARAVVGVVADTKTVDLKKAPRPTVYVASAQSTLDDAGMFWIMRTDHPEILGEQVRRAVVQVEPRQRVQRLSTMEQIVDSTTADSRFDAWIFGGFASLALLLSAIGVYGLLSFAVARRTNEIGTRMALGASRASVLRLVLRHGLGLTTVGLLVGMGGAMALTRSLATLLYGVDATDPASFAAVAVVLLLIGALASYIPARRATKVDPMIALRYE